MLSKAKRDALIIDNLEWAKVRARQHECCGCLATEDLEADAMLALCEAAAAWEQKGLFRTYAGVAIDNRVRRTLEGESKHWANREEEGSAFRAF